MSKDKLFDRKVPVGDFTFNKEVADVFDDMLNRSIPMYEVIQRTLMEMAFNFVQPETNIYDLGCSTGTTLMILAKHLRQVKQDPLCFIGLDLSSAMLTKTREKFEKNNIKGYKLFKHDLNEDFKFENSSCIFMNWTLQFVRPINRPKLLKSIYDGLNENGALIMVEKVIVKNPMLNRLYIDLYHNFKKRQAYSELEISKKREALENVLVPYRVEENCDLLYKTGFSIVDIFFKWYNFCGIIAQKRG
jgi:tRNA (cmo5U34)-methyltransferase